jgi:hypothetical protein
MKQEAAEEAERCRYGGNWNDRLGDVLTIERIGDRDGFYED